MKRFTHRTYVVSSGDNFSAGKAKEFETQKALSENSYNILTVPRARRVHQSYLTAPFTTLQCLCACLLVLCGRHPDQRLPKQYNSPYPDLILINGPATAVCVTLAAKIIRFFQYLFGLGFLLRSSTKPPASKMRILYVESWARVKKLSISGLLLLPLADSFLVQWPDLAGRRAWWGMKRTRYAGWLVA
jgi:beta-1,4-N-acetylglucosaminyltransferase